MNRLRSFAASRPVLFALCSMVAWMAMALVFVGMASGALGRPYGDAAATTIGRLAVAACFVWLLWRLGWLKPSGVAGQGTWWVWLIALAGTLYFAAASLYSFFGQAALDLPSLIRNDESLPIVSSSFAVVLSEEILFRGLVLYVLVRAWASTRRGLVGSVAVASLLFAVMHITQVLTYGISLSSALLLTVQTFMIAIWWSVLVLWGRSIWPAATAHFVGNTVVALGQLVTPVVGDGPVAYMRVLAFSLLLGVLGIGILMRLPVQALAPEDAA